MSKNILLALTSIVLACGVIGCAKNNDVVLEKALSPEVLKNTKITIQGSGGPCFELPNGQEVNRDVIYNALVPLIEKYKNNPEIFLKGLESRQFYIRYAVHLALRLITQKEASLYLPINEPTSRESQKGIKEWRAIIAGSVDMDK